MSGRPPNTLAQALKRDIQNVIVDLDLLVTKLECRVEQLCNHLLRLKTADLQELSSMPAFVSAGRENWQDILAEYSKLSADLGPVISRLNRLKTLSLPIDSIEDISARATQLAQAMSHQPSREKNVGTLIEAMKPLFTAPPSEAESELDPEEPSYYVVGGAFGLTLATISSVGLKDFMELDAVGLATVGDLMREDIRTAEDLKVYVSREENQARLNLVRASAAVKGPQSNITGLLNSCISANASTSGGAPSASESIGTATSVSS